MSATAQNIAPWVEQPTEVVTVTGKHTVPAIVHALCPGLAVTMNHFGTFDVTHIGTGRTAAKGYERCASAMVAAAELAHCADWTKSVEEISAWLKEHGHESAGVESATVTEGGVTLPMTKKKLVEFIRMHEVFDEFPWEGSDGPHGALDGLMNALASRSGT